jgi:hypothetical protein
VKLEKNCMIHNQCVNLLEGRWEINIMYHASILRNKLNQRGEKYLYRKLKNTKKKLKKKQRNRKTSYVHGMEDLILLNYQYMTQINL